jgi:hypothetical protein
MGAWTHFVDRNEELLTRKKSSGTGGNEVWHRIVERLRRGDVQRIAKQFSLVENRGLLAEVERVQRKPDLDLAMEGAMRRLQAREQNPDPFPLPSFLRPREEPKEPVKSGPRVIVDEDGTIRPYPGETRPCD